MVSAGQDFLARQSTRFDMPNFRPRVDWVREMKRYGILSATVDPNDSIDFYAVERDYWKSLWYRPAGQNSEGQ